MIPFKLEKGRKEQIWYWDTVDVCSELMGLQNRQHVFNTSTEQMHYYCCLLGTIMPKRRIKSVMLGIHGFRNTLRNRVYLFK